MEDTEKKELDPAIQAEAARIGCEVVAELQKDKPDEGRLKELSEQMDKAMGIEVDAGEERSATIECPYCDGKIKVNLTDE